MYTQIPSFLDVLPIEVTADHWVEFPVLHGRFSLVIDFIYGINSIYVSIPISILLSPLSPLLCIRLFSTCVSVSALQIVYTIFLYSIYMH